MTTPCGPWTTCSKNGGRSRVLAAASGSTLIDGRQAQAPFAGELAMSSRTLARHVRAATGRGPLALVQGVRLNHAPHLIESSRLTIAQVVERVGYEDATALRRLTRKAAGAAPSRFRASWRASA